MMAAGVFKRGTIPPTVVKLQDEDDCADDLPGTCEKGQRRSKKKDTRLERKDCCA